MLTIKRLVDFRLAVACTPNVEDLKVVRYSKNQFVNSRKLSVIIPMSFGIIPDVVSPTVIFFI